MKLELVQSLPIGSFSVKNWKRKKKKAKNSSPEEQFGHGQGYCDYHDIVIQSEVSVCQPIVTTNHV